MSTKITVDGLEATQKLAEMIKESPHCHQLRVVMLNGITFAGFNIVDIKALSQQTELPVIAVTDRKPNLREVHAALEHLPNCEERWNAILNAGEFFSVPMRGGKQQICVETAGITRERAVEVLHMSALHSKVPEALRVAHLIASGISLSS